jgi:hypothetical protein
MIICRVDAWFSAMEEKDIKEELKVVEKVLAALDGELIGAEVGTAQRRLVVHVRAESELVVSDIFEASHFTVEHIACLGWSYETPVDFDRPAACGTWRYRPAPQAGACGAAQPPM